MAVAAEAITFEGYLSVDSISEFAVARREVREEAWAVVRMREQQIAAQQEAHIPLAIDALSEAQAVLETESRYGTESFECRERTAGLQLSTRRLVAEWYRKKKPEYFAPTRHYFDASTGDFFSHGWSIRQMTENALRPISDNDEEVARRVNEKVENETPNVIRKLGGIALHEVALRTFSECTDKAIDDYRADMAAGRRHQGYDGYVPEIEKLMIRDMRFDEVTGDRWEEQIGLPGIYINKYVIRKVLNERGVAAKEMTKTELHGTQLLVKDDLMELAERLDTAAGEEWRTNIFMGEKVPEGFVKDYQGFRAEALLRQKELQDIADVVVTYLLDLAADGVEPRKAPAMVEEFVKLQLLKEAKKDSALAEQMFDKSTAAKLVEVVELESIGDTARAFRLFEEARSEAPGGGYCGAGSCGLEGVDRTSEKGKQLAEKLKAEDGDTIVRDTERACKCGKRSIVYAYNENRVNKYCESCQAYESKRTRKAA